MCHLAAPCGTASARDGCMFWCFPAFSVNLCGKFSSAKVGDIK